MIPKKIMVGDLPLNHPIRRNRKYLLLPHKRMYGRINLDKPFDHKAKSEFLCC